MVQARDACLQSSSVLHCVKSVSGRSRNESPIYASAIVLNSMYYFTYIVKVLLVPKWISIAVGWSWDSCHLARKKWRHQIGGNQIRVDIVAPALVDKRPNLWVVGHVADALGPTKAQLIVYFLASIGKAILITWLPKTAPSAKIHAWSWSLLSTRCRHKWKKAWNKFSVNGLCTAKLTKDFHRYTKMTSFTTPGK